MKVPRKSFMTLPKSQLSYFGQKTLENAVKKQKEAEVLSQAGYYDTASFLLITSIEESVKSLILFLDYNGFQFRQRVNGIRTVFNQHGLRHNFAFVMLCFNHILKEVNRITKKISSQEPLGFENCSVEDWLRWMNWKIYQLEKEISWFESINETRENGLYVDVVQSSHSYREIGKADYLLILEKAESVSRMVESLNTLLVDKTVIKEVKKLKKWFFTHDIYKRMGEVIVKINKREGGSIVLDVKEFVENYKEALNDEDSIALTKDSLKKLRNRIF